MPYSFYYQGMEQFAKLFSMILDTGVNYVVQEGHEKDWGGVIVTETISHDDMVDIYNMLLNE